MGITPQFGSGAVAAKVAAFHQRLEKATVFMFKYLGEELVKYAKDRHNYQDQTGNLTNSMGYAVVRDKEIIYNSATNQPGVGGEEALKIVQKMAATLPNTYSLIIVAGMNYAAYVEAKGYNVILPAELKAQTDFPQAIAKLSALAKSKAQEMFGTI